METLDAFIALAKEYGYESSTNGSRGTIHDTYEFRIWRHKKGGKPEELDRQMICKVYDRFVRIEFIPIYNYSIYDLADTHDWAELVRTLKTG